MSLPVALQLYTVRDEMQADFEGTLRKVKKSMTSYVSQLQTSVGCQNS